MDQNAALRRALLADTMSQSLDLLRHGFAATRVGMFEEAQIRFLQETRGRLRSDPRAWQILGLAERGLQDSAAAHVAFLEAARLAPADSLIAHSVARSALEAGYPAVILFDRARQLAPSDGSILLGRAAAQIAEGRADKARGNLAALLASNPRWIDGHLTLARLAAAADPSGDCTFALADALRQFPKQAELWLALLRVLAESQNYDGLIDACQRAAVSLGDLPELTIFKAQALEETGRADVALELLLQLPARFAKQVRVPVLRCLIRLGRMEEASEIAERTSNEDRDIWPYRALIWRVMNDERWHALEGDHRLIGMYDLSAKIDLHALHIVLSRIHSVSTRMIDQSVRGGTQTDGNLLARAEPELRGLRSALLKAVTDHVFQLPSVRPGHPTLLHEREPIRFAGAWSVRLTGGGYHVDHVHQQGWLSAVFYVSTPDESEGDSPGDLVFGGNRALLGTAGYFRKVSPRPGQLVIFPSTMWHGTRPFPEGERLTVAFDIAPPRGSFANA